MRSPIVAAPIDPNSGVLHLALEAAALPIDDLSEPGRRFFQYSQNGRAVAFGGFELHGADALLRSIVVLPEALGQGFGRHATAFLLSSAAGAGAGRAWLLTTSASSFFERLGFQTVRRELAPNAILATRQFSSLCPSTAALMSRLIHRGVS